VPMPALVISFILESNSFLNDKKLASSFSRMFKSNLLRSSLKSCLNSPVQGSRNICYIYCSLHGYGLPSPLVACKIHLINQRSTSFTLVVSKVKGTTEEYSSTAVSFFVFYYSAQT
jgi:hypothetical protein